MIIIENKYIPFAPFSAINLCGIVFCRRNVRLTEREKRHEYIHTLQQREMLFVGFFLWYVAEWCIRLVQYRSTLKAYRNISFEREAYCNEHKKDYLTMRSLFSWIKYLKNGTGRKNTKVNRSV